MRLMSLMELLKSEAPPQRIGELHPRKDYIARRHVDGAIRWYDHHQGKENDRIIDEHRESFVGSQAPEHKQLVQNFVNHVRNMGTRHAIAAGDRSAQDVKPRARHVKLLIQKNPMVRMKVEGHDRLLFSAHRHGEAGGSDRVDHWSYGRSGLKYHGATRSLEDHPAHAPEHLAASESWRWWMSPMPHW